MNPRSDPNFQEGCRRYWAGEFQEAIELLSRAAEQWPSFADAFNHIGLCHDAIGNFSRAIANYESAMQLAIKFRDPESEGMMRVHIAETLGQQRRYAEAETYLQEVLKAPFSMETRAQAFSVFADILIWQHRPDDASAKLAEGRECMNHFAIGRGCWQLHSARVCVLRNDFAGAHKHFRSAAWRFWWRNRDGAAETRCYRGVCSLLENRPYCAAEKDLNASYYYFVTRKPSFGKRIAGSLADVCEQMGHTDHIAEWRRRAG